MKKIFTLLTAVCALGVMYGQQGITSATIDGSLAPASRRTTNPGEIQAVVAPGFNMSNVTINCVYATDYSLIGTMPSNFSVTNPQLIQVTDGTATGNWQILIKKINPTALPFDVAFAATGTTTDSWTAATVGWAASGVDVAQKGTCRYGTAGASFVVAFNTAPGTVTYTMNSVSNPFKGGDEFDVEASADGVNWRTLRSFTTDGALTTTQTPFTDNLAAADRYVRWVYAKRTGINVNLNNISVTASTATAIDQVQTSDDCIFTQPEAGVVNFTQPVSKVEIYNLVGKRVQVINNPGSSISIADGTKGVAIIRATLESGKVISQKMIK